MDYEEDYDEQEQEDENVMMIAERWWLLNLAMNLVNDRYEEEYDENVMMIWSWYR